jgi:hypothetical protein
VGRDEDGRQCGLHALLERVAGTDRIVNEGSELIQFGFPHRTPKGPR